jgi:hypothetical protein
MGAALGHAKTLVGRAGNSVGAAWVQPQHQGDGVIHLALEPTGAHGGLTGTPPWTVALLPRR